MKPVVIRYRIYLWTGIFLLSLCLGYAVWRGRWTMAFPAVLLSSVFFALGSQKHVFSEVGIESRFLCWSDVRPWTEVSQAGIADVADQGCHGAYLLLTFLGGTPKNSAMGFRDWKQRNAGTCMYVPADQFLREMVLRCYGPLDFDLTE